MSEVYLFLTHCFLFAQRHLFLWVGEREETMKPMQAFSAMSTASSVSDAQIKNLHPRDPHVVAS